MINEQKEEYKKSTQQQKDLNDAPDTPECILKLVRWFPLRFFAMLGGLFFIAFPILDMIINTAVLNFTSFFIFVYIILFGIVVVFIEAPTTALTRKIQLKISFWFRLLSRTWGRAWFYVFVSFLAFGEIGNASQTFSITIIAGIYMMIIAIISFFLSRHSALKYQRMYIFIAAGAENEQLLGNLIRKFEELDVDQDGRLDSDDITKCAEQAGRSLSRAESYAIRSFLDESCNGYVAKEDWMKQWTQYNLKQRFL